LRWQGGPVHDADRDTGNGCGHGRDHDGDCGYDLRQASVERETVKTSITIAAPLYNEEENAAELVRRIKQSVRDLPVEEILFVLDGCTDGTLDILLAEKKEEPRIRIVELTRNFGLQAAVHACLQENRGDVLVVMDGDLQDPPEVIPELVGKLEQGCDIVYAKRKSRQEGLLQRLMIAFFYRLQQRLVDFDIPAQTGNFSCLSRRAIDEILRLTESNRFFPGLRSWTALPSAEVLYDRDARYAGKPKQSFLRLCHYALDGIYNFSAIPLKFSFFIGAIGLIFGAAMICNVLYQRLVTHQAVPGWTSIIICISLFSGAQLVSLGILGSYIRRIHDEVRRRPQYLVRRMWE